MSHCSFLECDIYMYNDISGGISCHVSDGTYFKFKTRSEAISRLKELSKTMEIPERVFERLNLELAELGETSGLEETTNYQLEKFLNSKECQKELKQTNSAVTNKTFLGMPLVEDPSLPANTVELRTEKQIVRGQIEDGKVVATLLKARS